MNSYLGLQGTVNEDEIALKFGTWDSAVIVYEEVQGDNGINLGSECWYLTVFLS